MEVSKSIIVKKEPPSSPEIRHRPQKLDLSANNNLNSSSDINNSYPPTVSRPLTGQLTGRIDGLGIQEVGLACLSPGFNTQDPTMRDHLQKSLSVREQQRTLIEARMNKQSSKMEGTSVENAKDREVGGVFAGNKTPGTSKRKAPPPGLSIVTPSHEEFAQERIIQSAPLNQSFTTARYQPQPLTRHVANQPSNLSKTSHIHHVEVHPQTRSPANATSTLPTKTTTTTPSTSANTTSFLQHAPAIQSGNRLPPLVDIFGGEHLALRENLNQGSSTGHTNGKTSNSHVNSRPPFPSPSQATAQSLHSGRPREYRSAEEAQADLSGGRPELLPKMVHYGGHQPPTPPSPRNIKTATQNEVNRSGSGSSSRRRQRVEYEEGGSPPLGSGPSSSRRTRPFAQARNSPMSAQVKREHFIRLCTEAWDLFHS